MADPALVLEKSSLKAPPGLLEDNWLSIGTVDKAMLAQPIGLIVQQLKIISLLLREGLGINISDEDLTLLAQPPNVINPPATNNSI